MHCAKVGQDLSEHETQHSDQLGVENSGADAKVLLACHFCEIAAQNVTDSKL
jgi:hypothetical protein